METDYQWLLSTPAGKKWQRLGMHKRAGVVVPLFSLYSNESTGIGEFPDLIQLVDWCQKTGLSIIQLLPLNDTGFNFTPYDAQSMFALDPMYLSLTQLKNVDLTPFRDRLKALKADYPCGGQRLNYGIKAAKLALLWEIFQTSRHQEQETYQDFKRTNAYWLDDYGAFKVLKEKHDQKDWLHWDQAFQHKLTEPTKAYLKSQEPSLAFQTWLQWQAFEQMAEVKHYATGQGVYLMGDLPFLVSKDSADVWAHQEHFKLNLAAGAPPDLYFASGQRWGMPPYHWDHIAHDNYRYLREKCRYAGSFYDLFRIDHFVGLFRLWTIPNEVPDHEAAQQGYFDPPDESQWEEHGKKILEVMLESTDMLPCAEDLGVVPDCSFKVIKAYGIVGTEVQRWMRLWRTNCDFKGPEAYRPNSIAAISTHDIPILQDWWENELGTVDELAFRKKCEGRGFDVSWLIGQLFYSEKSASGRLRWRNEIDSQDTLLGILYRRSEEVRDFLELFNCSRYEMDKFLAFLGTDQNKGKEFTPALARQILEKTNETASIFSLQMLQDWLSVSPLLQNSDPMMLRINVPGTVQDGNWTLVMPFSLEQLNRDAQGIALIQDINQSTGRLRS